MRLRDGKSLHLAFWRPCLAIGCRSVMSRAGGEFSQHEGHIPTTGDTGCQHLRSAGRSRGEGLSFLWCRQNSASSVENLRREQNEPRYSVTTTHGQFLTLSVTK